MSDEFFGPAQHAALEMARMAGETNGVSPSDLELLKRKKAAIKTAYEEEHKYDAKYKIEIQLGTKRTGRESFPGAVMIFRSGGILGGGADEIMYPCPDVKCVGYIGPEHISAQEQIGVCPKCNVRFSQSELKEGRFFRLPSEKWAEVLEREFHRCGGSADFVLKTRKDDIRTAALLEQAGRGGEALYSSRSGRIVVVYSLKALIHDTAGSHDVYSRILAFLRA